MLAVGFCNGLKEGTGQWHRHEAETRGSRPHALRAQGLETETSPNPSELFLLPLSLSQRCQGSQSDAKDLAGVPGISQGCQKCWDQAHPKYVWMQFPLKSIKVFFPIFCCTSTKSKGRVMEQPVPRAEPWRARLGSLKSLSELLLCGPLGIPRLGMKAGRALLLLSIPPTPLSDGWAQGCRPTTARIITSNGLSWQLPKRREDEAWAEHFL